MRCLVTGVKIASDCRYDSTGELTVPEFSNHLKRGSLSFQRATRFLEGRDLDIKESIKPLGSATSSLPKSYLLATELSLDSESLSRPYQDLPHC
jgi:hypothetical protein